MRCRGSHERILTGSARLAYSPAGMLGTPGPATLQAGQHECLSNVRHYAGTRLLQQTRSLEHVARHLGHAQIETSRIYAKWSDETLREALSAW